jgi:tol-pal system protein YbgF
VIRRIRVGLVPVVVLAAGACFATREDVRLLQNQMQAAQAQSAHADSDRQAQLDRVIEQLGLVNDSLGRIGGQLTKFQGDVEGSVYAMGQQLIQIQELTGQSQRRLQELRAGLEAQRATAVTPPPIASTPSPTDTAGQAAPPSAGQAPGQTPAAGTGAVVTSTGTVSGANGTPGPNQLYEMALDQLRRGSTTAARTALQDLLRQYPNADVAADAQFYVAETFAKEHDTAAADSGYRLVAQRFPASDRAPQALFKHALVLQAQHKVQAARAAYQEVITKYPRSDEAVLAKDRLRAVR